MRTSIVALAAALCLGSVLAACGGGGGGGGIPTTPTLSPTPSPTPTPTPSSQTSTVAVSPAATTAPIPAVAGFTGSVSLPSSNAGSNTTITATSTTVAPNSAPALQSLRRAQTASSPTVYLYESFTASATVTFNGAPGFTLTLPPSINTAGQDFYIALFVPGLMTQWQPAIEGPAQVSGQTITFPAQSGPNVTLTQGQIYWFAFYSVPTPTAIPTPTPTPTATPTPTPTSQPQVALSPTSLSFLATGAQYAQSFAATQSGNTEFSAGSCTSGTTTIADVTAGSSAGQFTVTPDAAGTCTVTVTGANNQTATLQITVTTTTVGGH